MYLSCPFLSSMLLEREIMTFFHPKCQLSGYYRIDIYQNYLSLLFSVWFLFWLQHLCLLVHTDFENILPSCDILTSNVNKCLRAVNPRCWLNDVFSWRQRAFLYPGLHVLSSSHLTALSLAIFVTGRNLSLTQLPVSCASNICRFCLVVHIA